MGASKRKKCDSKTKGLKCSICICDCRVKTHPMSSSRIGSVGSNDPFGALTDKLKESKKNIINGKFFILLVLKTKQKYFSRVRLVSWCWRLWKY